uniref:Uncharacterized protein n=1 Tax=Calcidiscus leptoporus TaxID=127549 RepID=A0A7S0ILG8_9EUKA
MRGGEPITFVALGASNTVRGGCQQWQSPSKCSTPKYCDLTEDGNPHGWLLQAFTAINRTWPHPQHRLVNHAMMATGPEAFVRCLNKYVPVEADAVLLSFADMCAPIRDDKQPETVEETARASYGVALEAIIRRLNQQADPPAILFFNVFLWTNFWHCRGLCHFSQSCDPYLGELAHFYHASRVGMREALWHEAHDEAHELPRETRISTGSPAHTRRYEWEGWTIEGGRHLDLGNGDKLAAELLFYWARRVYEHAVPRAAPDMRVVGWLSEGGLRSKGAASRAEGAASCFSFDDNFGGLVAAPRVVAARGWRYVELDSASAVGPERLKRKPGYKASKVDAVLEVDTLSSGPHQVSVGFLRTYSSQAVVRLSCLAPCRCVPSSLSAHSDATTSTTVFSSALAVESPASKNCHIELRLLSEGVFKFNGLQIF